MKCHCLICPRLALPGTSMALAIVAAFIQRADASTATIVPPASVRAPLLIAAVAARIWC